MCIYIPLMKTLKLKFSFKFLKSSSVLKSNLGNLQFKTQCLKCSADLNT